MNDCNHPRIKCMECMRYLSQDPEEPRPVRDVHGYLPATFKDGVYEKGPFRLSIVVTGNGLSIELWDITDDVTLYPLERFQPQFDECMNPYATYLTRDPNQVKLPLEDCLSFDLGDLP